MKFKVYSDGAARGNPGPAGAGVALCDEKDRVIEQHSRFLGTATNNIAEYEALVTAVKAAAKHLPCSVTFLADSELVIRQINGQYKVKEESLKGYCSAVRELSGIFDKVEFEHIPRKENKLADMLANKAIDRSLKGRKTKSFAGVVEGSPRRKQERGGKSELYLDLFGENGSG